MKIPLYDLKNILYQHGWSNIPNTLCYINPMYKKSTLFVSNTSIRYYRAGGAYDVYYYPTNGIVEFDEENKLLIIEDEVAIKI